MEIAKIHTCPTQENGHNVPVRRKIYLSQTAYNAQITQPSPYCADTKCKLFENSILLRGFRVPPRAQKYTSEFGFKGQAGHLNPFCHIRVKQAHRQPSNYQFVRADRQTSRKQ